jgi:hypothetical protein
LVACCAVVAALQYAILKSPTQLAEPVAVRDGTPIVAYKQRAARRSAPDAVRLTLYANKPFDAHRLGLRLERAGHSSADPVVEPPARRLIHEPPHKVTLTVVPRGRAGGWRFRLGRGAPFGQLNVSK